MSNSAKPYTDEELESEGLSLLEYWNRDTGEHWRGLSFDCGARLLARIDEDRRKLALAVEALGQVAAGACIHADAQESCLENCIDIANDAIAALTTTNPPSDAQ